MKCFSGRVAALLLLAGALGGGPNALGQLAAPAPAMLATPTAPLLPVVPLPASAFAPEEPPYHSLTGIFTSSGAHFVTTQSFVFIDPRGMRWEAPVGTVTDGVSIPRLWMSIIGAPTEAQFMKAAILHDAYCAADNRGGASYHTRSRRIVDRMFYDALRASGIGRAKARVMYTCLSVFSPVRWNAEERPGVPPVESVNTAAGTP